MDLQTLANVGEFVGGLVVVVSVIYLAIQIRHSTRAQRTQNYAVALNRLCDFQARMGQDAEFADLLLAGARDVSRLSRQQRIQFTWVFYEMFGAFEFMFHQADDGTLPDGVWQRWRTTLQWWLAFPGVQTWWRSRPAPFTDGFSAEVERLHRAGLPDPAAQQRWAEFLGGRHPDPIEKPA